MAKYLLQSCCDGESWATVASSDNSDELVAQKKEADHHICSGIDLRVISHEAYKNELLKQNAEYLRKNWSKFVHKLTSLI